MADLVEKFVYTETLSSKSMLKSATLLGTIDGEPAIVTLEKLPFNITDPDFLKSLNLAEVRNLDVNDIYSWNVATVHQDLETRPAAKVNLIYPATETHIKKYREQQRIVVVETPEKYRQIVEPYIETMKGDRIKWVYNILFDGVEADRVILRDDDPEQGFVLLPDMKWDRKTIESMYLVAIALRKDISSIRDLTKEHIPYLQHLKFKITAAVQAKYGLAANQLKMYFHYQPSYYHLHLHVANVAHEQLDFGKSILIDNVIDQLTYLGDMKKATISYVLGTGHQLYVKGLKE
ncbi:m7GpppX diphosphatase [Trichomonascus vanleenenianus]|uniref:m7GpppX diphosphatase n=1 Tax=Trichomonascus vanleenenianus TaxID=2268995 RepID=UPI003EC963B0